MVGSEIKLRTGVDEYTLFSNMSPGKLRLTGGHQVEIYERKGDKKREVFEIYTGSCKMSGIEVLEVGCSGPILYGLEEPTALDVLMGHC